MKALTIWQPWASLIMAGAKRYEFRGWPAPAWMVGAPMATHAGARPVKREEVKGLIARLKVSTRAWETALDPEIAIPILERVLARPDILPLSSVLGRVTVGKPVRSWEVAGEFGGKVNDSDRDKHSNWAWPMRDIHVFEPFHPCAGKQGLWDWHGGDDGVRS